MDQTPQTLDLTPEIIHIETQQGTDATIEFALTDNAGVGVDITDDSVLFTAKTEYGGAVTIATKTNSPGQHSSPMIGQTIFVLTKTNTTTLTPADEVAWVYEVRRRFAQTDREVIYIHGNLKLKPSVGISV